MIVWGLMIKFKLDDIKRYELEFGDKFYLSERKKRQNLRAGDIVKLIFRFEDDEFAQVERMWIVINSANNGEYTSTLGNKPLTKWCLGVKSESKFNCKDEI